MNPTRRDPHRPESGQTKPWYRYPWPWVAIAIPAVAVAGGLFTLYLAVTNPDPLIVEDHRYEELRAGLQAQPEANDDVRATEAERDHDDRDD